MAALRALVAALLVLVAPGLAAAPSEYQVKAVFLFNFSQFVEWPAQSLGPSAAPFSICIVGEDRFGAQLEATVQGENVQGHPFIVKRYAHPAAIESSCQILFIDNSEAAQLDSITGALGGHAVLTVSDIEHSAEHGAMIQFTNDRNRLRLRINVAAAKSAGLTISSKLLRPAEIIGEGRG
jgi:YfiR/HmsC-like